MSVEHKFSADDEARIERIWSEKISKGDALVLPDDTVLVHRRPYNATHVAGVFDCSTAGFCLSMLTDKILRSA